jgi:hypothetical protein
MLITPCMFRSALKINRNVTKPLCQREQRELAA